MVARTHEQFLIDLRERQPVIFEIYEILSEYTSNHSHLKVRCRKCGQSTDKTPSKLLTGRGCETCRRAKQRGLLTERLLNLKGLTVTIPDQVVSSSRVSVVCDKGHCFTARVSKLIEGIGCKLCSHISMREDETFFELIKTSYPKVKLLGQYVNSHTKILARCSEHGEFYLTPTKVRSKNQVCIKCSEKKVYYYTLTLAERLKDEFLLIPSGVYLIEIVGRGIKIGISKAPKDRHSKIIKSSGCEIKLLHYIPMSLYDAITLEATILNKYRLLDNPYKFCGSTELVTCSLDEFLVELEGMGSSGTGTTQAGGKGSALNAGNKA